MRLKRVEQIYVRFPQLFQPYTEVDCSLGCRSAFPPRMGHGPSQALIGYRLCHNESAAADQSKRVPSRDAVSYDRVYSLGESAKGDHFTLATQEQPPMPPPSIDEIDVIRHREITSKAVSAIVLLTLKWFKVSRRFTDLDRSMRFDERRPRCYEVSPSRAAPPRYKLFITHPQDVRSAGGFCFSSFEG
jgi:hypothetical protein